ncbi:murein biosynthesis integral membrane protein MurJ [Labrys monachus]|uniref:Probable lipid II flippase MurJ n=1 Tax=Labrys monachus TaxID=217067 RepID=A0ABU0FIX7_9HYPH|nr:murein biosynthesis integral membrane protein MurJ [Labrys monachus]MDQ0394568.1 putative peptidoglycan lipid II flippase [Labrys monachus]
MLKNILSIGAWTMVSRVTGFARDAMMAAILGSGPAAEAFIVAFRLPNHFRAIFGEGAFNAAFVPAYARVHEQSGNAAARLFLGRIVSLLLISQVILLGLALLFMPQLVALLAPGFEGERLALSVTLTRITFPYLLLITLATLYGGVLNASGRFTAAAAAPALLNVAMIGTLACAWVFPTAAHAAAWGVTISGVLQLAVMLWAAKRAHVLAKPEPVHFDAPVKGFFSALGPATIGSMGVQIALFADTIIASVLSAGAVAALYYADRINQLPLGIIGIAAGTVLLPEMSRLVAAGRTDDAHAAQRRTIFLTWLMAAPFLAGFITVPDLIMRALFMRGAFTAQSADAAAAALYAYGIGLPAVVLIRSAVASFYSRGDTKTPLWASLSAVAVNVVFKVLLMGPLQQAGLAFATSIGAWINLGILVVLATRRGYMVLDRRFWSMQLGIAVATLLMGVAMSFAESRLTPLIAWLPRGQEVGLLALVGVVGSVVYVGTTFAFFRALGIRLGRR